MIRAPADPFMPATLADLPQSALSEALAAAERTAWRIAFVEFSWDVEKALDFALLKACAVPAISRLFVGPGQVERRRAARCDDIALLIYEVMRNGLASDRAKRAFARLDALRERMGLLEDDYLYVLSALTFTPIDWIAAYGRRRLTAAERQDWFLYWSEFGWRAGMPALYETSEDFRAFVEDYEVRRFAYDAANRRIAEPMIDFALGGRFAPRFLRPTLRPLVLAICDGLLVAALGFDEPPRWLRLGVAGALAWRRVALRALPAPRAPKWRQIGRRSYPKGYEIEDLGAFAQNDPTCAQNDPT